MHSVFRRGFLARFALYKHALANEKRKRSTRKAFLLIRLHATLKTFFIIISKSTKVCSALFCAVNKENKQANYKTQKARTDVCTREFHRKKLCQLNCWVSLFLAGIVQRACPPESFSVSRTEDALYARSDSHNDEHARRHSQVFNYSPAGRKSRNLTRHVPRFGRFTLELDDSHTALVAKLFHQYWSKSFRSANTKSCRLFDNAMRCNYSLISWSRWFLVNETWLID